MGLQILIYGLLTTAGLAYLLLISYLRRALRVFSAPAKVKAESQKPVSIVIPFCDDAQFAGNLIRSLENLQSPVKPPEIILVNDHSREIEAEQWREVLKKSRLQNARIIENDRKPGKKSALGMGVSLAHNPLILQTDADCELPENWIPAMLAEMDDNTGAVMGLVKMEGNTFWSRFAALDFMSLQATGMAMAARRDPIMANGANLAFRRDLWLRHNFHPTEPASGDDTFFIQHIRESYRVGWTIASAVKTRAPATYRGFIHQRLRWGGKTSHYPSSTARLVAWIVALANTAIVVSIPLAFFHYSFLLVGLALLSAKAAIDYRFLRFFARYTGQQHLMSGYWKVAVLYPFYIVHVLSLIVTQSQDSWKGRPIKVR